jgi:hypothetical protein
MTASDYETLKCDNCGKKLGYIYINVRTFPPKWYIHAIAGGPLNRIEKNVLCDDCFQRRMEASKTKQR